MLTFHQYLNEHFDNITSRQYKEKYRDQVWDILTKSYQYIGGIRGSGFANSQQMVDTIPYWKLYRVYDDVKAVILYKDKNGRKMVALGSDQSEQGKRVLKRMMIDEIVSRRSYGEISDAVLKFYQRHLTKQQIEKYFVKAVDAIKRFPQDQQDDIKIIDEYTYERTIGNQRHRKMMYGPTNQSFKGR